MKLFKIQRGYQERIEVQFVFIFVKGNNIQAGLPLQRQMLAFPINVRRNLTLYETLNAFVCLMLHPKNIRYIY